VPRPSAQKAVGIGLSVGSEAGVGWRTGERSHFQVRKEEKPGRITARTEEKVPGLHFRDGGAYREKEYYIAYGVKKRGLQLKKREGSLGWEKLVRKRWDQEGKRSLEGGEEI